MKTYIPKPAEISKKWVVIDAKGKILGRVATRAASILRGKTKPEYTPFLDVGDNVIILNSAEVAVTGTKRKNKIYYRHSGYPGGIKSSTLQQMLDKKPEDVIRKAVVGMLPKNRLGRKMVRHLRVYPGADHPHQAQNPETVEV